LDRRRGRVGFAKEMIKLVISDNDGSTTSVPLVRDEISIGRKDGNTIRLTERNISREHCRLERVNGSFRVRDLGSYNGVLVNGARVAGESEVKPGDEIRIGDYTLLIQAEAAAQPSPSAEVAPSKAPPSPRPPARVVVLTVPLAGAEFSLPERGEARVGRAPELDIALDHRSVSREHCTLVCDGDEVRVKDHESVNGIIVNRQKVKEARLLSGDVVELGDVVLRFVGAGENYVFDPEEARALVGARRPRSAKTWPMVAAIGAGTLLVAMLIARSGGKSGAGKEAIVPEPAPPAAAAAVAAPAPAVPAAAPAADRFPELLAACLEANRSGRFAEAVAHANAALKVRQGAADALGCLQTASVNHEQEQIFVRSKAALDAGDTESASRELAALRADSVVLQRKDVADVVGKLAGLRLTEAKELLRKDPERAGEVARQTLTLRPLSEDLGKQAHALAAKADAARSAKSARPESPASKPTEPRAPRPSTSDKPPPMEAASACLARGDNQCVVRALNGRTQTERELGLLIETYRAMGESSQAQRNMALYVQRYPTARRADTYRQMLERRASQ
jgi:pSer/pThr/pTyr-binding forkhead associated (FHA) protein